MGEYIEREAVTAMLKRECSPRVMAYLVDELCKIPAADVRPVVRGRWKLEEGIMYCSECNKSPHYVYIPVDEWNFCPNCGARMEES